MKYLMITAKILLILSLGETALCQAGDLTSGLPAPSSISVAATEQNLPYVYT
jgi:hypothetical protein